MEQQNGYFQITWNDTIAVCHLFAPKAKGVRHNFLDTYDD